MKYIKFILNISEFYSQYYFNNYSTVTSTAQNIQLFSICLLL